MLILLLGIPGIKADTTNLTKNLTGAYFFNNQTGENESYLLNANGGGSLLNLSVTNPFNHIPGFIGKAYNFSRTLPTTITQAQVTDLSAHGFTVCDWIKPGLLGVQQYILSGGDAGGAGSYLLNFRNTNDILWGVRSSGDWIGGSGGSTNDVTKWYRICGVWNSTGGGSGNSTLYINGTAIGTSAVGSLDVFTLGGWGIAKRINDAGNEYNGSMDVLLFYDRGLSPTEIALDYQNGLNVIENPLNGTSLAALAPNITQINFTSDAPPEITCNYPNNCGNTTDTTPTFRVITDSLATCRISQTDQNYSAMATQCTQGGSFNTTASCTWTTPVSAGQNLFYFACQGSNSLNNSAPLGNNFKANLSMSIADFTAIQENFNATANETQSVGFSWIIGNNTANVADINATFTYNGTTTAATKAQTNSNWTFSYTTNAPLISVQGRNITYNWNATIYLTNGSILTASTSIKNNTIVFAYNPINITKDLDPLVETEPTNITVPFSEFNTSATTKLIIDYAGINYTMSESPANNFYQYITTLLINDPSNVTSRPNNITLYENITFNGVSMVRVANISGSQTILKINPIAITKTPNQIIETESTNVSIAMFKRNATATVLALIEYNGVNYTTSENPTNTFSKIFNTELLTGSASQNNQTVNISAWFIITSGNTTLTRLANGSVTQLVFRMVVTDCGGSTASTQRALNYTIKDEDTFAQVIGTSAGAYSVWKTDPNKNRNYSFNFTNSSTFGVCIFPTWANFSAQEFLQYGATNYITRYHNFFGTTISNSSINIDLLLGNSTLTQNLSLKVQDENANPLDNIIIEIYKQNIAGGNYSLVAAPITDSTGYTYVALESNFFYKYVIKQNGVIRITDEALLIPSITLKVFTIRPQVEPLLEHINNATSISFNLSFINLTKNIQFVWSDSNNVADLICLKIINQTKLNNTILYNNCSASVVGSMVYNVGDSSSYYIAIPYEFSNNVKYLMGDNLIVDLIQDYRKLGTEGVFWVLIIVLTTFFMGVGVAGLPGGLAFAAGAVLLSTMMGLIGFGWPAIISIILIALIIIKSSGL